MAKPEWGVKRSCQACGTRFYDMRKNPIECPSCGTKFDPEAVFRPRRPRNQPEEPAPAKEKPKAEPKDAEDELAALVDDDDLPEIDDDDDSDMGDDDLDDDEEDDVDVPGVGKSMKEDDDD